MAGYDSALLFDEEVFPVCAPSYLAERNEPLRPQDLADCDLLDLEYEKWHWMNWAIWLTEQGLDLPTKPRKLRINNYSLIIDAAKRGTGIALGWRHLIDDELKSGALVRPVTTTVSTAFAYYIVWPFNNTASPAVQAFGEWLLSERDLQVD